MEASLPDGHEELAGRLRSEGYALENLIGEGGGGEVWRAVHEASGRRVAVKVLHRRSGESSHGGNWLWRFQREVAAVTLLDHVHVCGMLDSGFLSGSRPWMAMELVEGPPLDEYAEEMELLPRGRVELFLKVCAGVLHAHRRGVLHRDLKPTNILVHHDGEPKVLDFGLARFLDEGLAPGPTLSLDGAVMGTPAFMAPEQAAGGAVDTRTDVYALGAVLFQMLTGEPPHGVPAGGTAGMLAAISRDEPRKLRSVRPDLDADLEAIVDKALRREPEARYSGVEALVADGERYLAGAAVAARKGQRLYQAGKWLRRNWRAAAAVLVVVGSVVGMLVYSGLEQRRTAERRKELLRIAQESMSRMLVEIGESAREAGHPEWAASAAEKMAAIPWDWAGEEGGQFDTRRFKSLSARLQADMQVEERRFTKAVPLYLDAVKASESLVREFPLQAAFCLEAGVARLGLGKCMIAMGKHREAVSSLETACRWMEGLPESGARHSLVEAERHLAALHVQYGRLDAAVACLKRARTLLAADEARELTPALRLLIDLGLQDVAARKPGSEKVIAEANATLAALEKWAGAKPLGLRTTPTLAEGLLLHADIMRHCLRWEEALDSLRRTRACYAEMDVARVRTNKEESDLVLGRKLREVGNGFFESGETERGFAVLEEAVVHFREARDSGLSDPRPTRVEVARTLRERARWYEKTGQPDDSAIAWQWAARRFGEVAENFGDRADLFIAAAEAALEADRLGYMPADGVRSRIEFAREHLARAREVGGMSADEQARVVELEKWAGTQDGACLGRASAQARECSTPRGISGPGNPSLRIGD